MNSFLHHRVICSYYCGRSSHHRTFCASSGTVLLYKVNINTNLVTTDMSKYPLIIHHWAHFQNGLYTLKSF